MKAGVFGRKRFNGVIATVVGVLGLVLSAPIFRAQSISMSYVTVGNSGNAPDPATGSLYGAVDFTYEIGEYDVTDSQYCTFLNDVDPTGANTLALYSPQGDAEYGITLNSRAANGSKYFVISGYSNMPVVEVDYWSTLRFVNWMNNGEGHASTETGAYTLIGGNTDEFGTPSNSASLLADPQPNAGAVVWLPSENEWYKSAYYDPANGTYSKYATQSNTEPGNIIGNGSNDANFFTVTGYSVTQSTSYSSGTNYLSPVGSYTGTKSYYGTYDQSGDVGNWVATVTSQGPIVRGGNWKDNLLGLRSSFPSDGGDPTSASYVIGFRVASVPEPNSIMVMLVGVFGLAVMGGRARKA